MALDKVEAIDLIKVAVDQIYAALKDTESPGKITMAEWLQIAQTVGVKAFQEAID